MKFCGYLQRLLTLKNIFQRAEMLLNFLPIAGQYAATNLRNLAGNATRRRGSLVLIKPSPGRNGGRSRADKGRRVAGFNLDGPPRPAPLAKHQAQSRGHSRYIPIPSPRPICQEMPSPRINAETVRPNSFSMTGRQGTRVNSERSRPGHICRSQAPPRPCSGR